MANQMPVTFQQSMMEVLQKLSAAMAAPDADLTQLTALQEQVVKTIRQPFDTASPGSPIGASMDMSQGAVAPEGAAPGQMSPMLQALMGGAGPAAPAPGSFPVPGVMAGPQPPNMDEVRRTMNLGA
jgi:hypothetical protein